MNFKLIIVIIITFVSINLKGQQNIYLSINDSTLINQLTFSRKIPETIITPEIQFNMINDSIWIHFYTFEKFLDRNKISAASKIKIEKSDSIYGYEKNPLRSKSHVFTKKELEKFEYHDLNWILKQHPEFVYDLVKDGRLFFVRSKEDDGSLIVFSLDRVEYYRKRDHDYFIYSLKSNYWRKVMNIKDLECSGSNEIDKPKPYTITKWKQVENKFECLNHYQNNKTNIYNLITRIQGNENSISQQKFLFDPKIGKVAYWDGGWNVAETINGKPYDLPIEIK